MLLLLSKRRSQLLCHHQNRHRRRKWKRWKLTVMNHLPWKWIRIRNTKKLHLAKKMKKKRPRRHRQKQKHRLLLTTNDRRMMNIGRKSMRKRWKTRILQLKIMMLLPMLRRLRPSKKTKRTKTTMRTKMRMKTTLMPAAIAATTMTVFTTWKMLRRMNHRQENLSLARKMTMMILAPMTISASVKLPMMMLLPSSKWIRIQKTMNQSNHCHRLRPHQHQRQNQNQNQLWCRPSWSNPSQW
mmetsp:Transcript_14261/g.40590  ORF Transcript_14261/g.40590 Transcript_14261/m.40590 type:complete len:240 (-) Transcript_14261:650-1369(-)